MANLRDYVEWHKAYDDPDSGLSWRLGIVQRYVREALVRHPRRVRVLSLCCGDSRDLLGVLSGPQDANRVRATLIELHPGIAQQARAAAKTAGLSNVDVKVADAGNTSSYEGAVPADLVIMVGIFGNISDADLERTIKATPRLCSRGATLIWSRGRDRDDRNDAIRASFISFGFSELDYSSREAGSKPALGAMSYQGEPQVLIPDRQLFTFLR